MFQKSSRFSFQNTCMKDFFISWRSLLHIHYDLVSLYLLFWNKQTSWFDLIWFELIGFFSFETNGRNPHDIRWGRIHRSWRSVNNELKRGKVWELKKSVKWKHCQVHNFHIIWKNNSWHKQKKINLKSFLNNFIIFMINCMQNLRNFNIVKRNLEICFKFVDEYIVYIYIYIWF
jgi:hypothetical protein